MVGINRQKEGPILSFIPSKVENRKTVGLFFLRFRSPLVFYALPMSGQYLETMSDHDFQIFRMALTFAVVSVFVAVVTLCNPIIHAALRGALWWFQCVGRVLLWISCGAVVMAGRDGSPIARVWFRHYWILCFALVCLAAGMEMQSYSLAMILIRCSLKLVPVLYIAPVPLVYFGYKGAKQFWESGRMSTTLSSTLIATGLYGLLRYINLSLTWLQVASRDGFNFLYLLLPFRFVSRNQSGRPLLFSGVTAVYCLAAVLVPWYRWWDLRGHFRLPTRRSVQRASPGNRFVVPFGSSDFCGNFGFH
jgi:hypothetical protein